VSTIALQAPAIELRDRLQAFSGEPKSSRGVNLSISRGERHAIHRPQRPPARTTLFQT